MTEDQKWCAEMLARMSTPLCIETISNSGHNGTNTIQVFEDCEDAVARACIMLDLILAEVSKPKCEACDALRDTIDRLANP